MEYATEYVDLFAFSMLILEDNFQNSMECI